ncbi:SIR2 family NAD-dependent protein deacylase [Draconibacterium halophilum]|uniref:protein acetyllysine N-acetyltransferase n=1 Tax=Draconibacterium halophilum TaxID=2706887 RepID=A0A6C0R989_9BACT|nr:Sir2 family NAD-dependent protein deacetylase [Draconibacterium halophilum]QIA06759.1 NAD-dependent deacylase [Draconibacterium halophilum]
MKKLVVLSGAGMSQESGLKTFRDIGGIWEQFDVTEVATPEAWERDPELVLRFYNERRKQLFNAQPNGGHRGIAELEKWFDVHVVTQNVDNLHERAGSKNVTHLHGELMKARSTLDSYLLYELENWELKLGDCCEKGSQLRPHIVWFGEAVTEIPNAIGIVQQAEILVVIGTSLAVYPAASLVSYVQKDTPIFVIDPHRPEVYHKNVTYIEKKAEIGVDILKKELEKLK